MDAGWNGGKRISRKGQGQDSGQSSLHSKVDWEEVGLNCGKIRPGNCPVHHWAIDE